MKLLELSCEKCGAPLEVSSDARFVTCLYCSARLHVRREDSAAWTELLDEVREDVRWIRNQQELSTLDREWQKKRAKLLGGDGENPRPAPSAVGAISTMVATITVGFLLLVPGFNGSGIGTFGAIGLLLLIFGITVGSKGVARAHRFMLEQAEYERERAELLERSHSVRQTISEVP